MKADDITCDTSTEFCDCMATNTPAKIRVFVNNDDCNTWVDFITEIIDSQYTLTIKNETTIRGTADSGSTTATVYNYSMPVSTEVIEQVRKLQLFL